MPTPMNVSAVLVTRVLAGALLMHVGVGSLDSAVQAAQGTASVSGCVVDTTGQPLPGVMIDVGGNGRHRVGYSGADGCYALSDVPADSSFAFARLAGFVSVTHDHLHLEPGQRQAIDFQMRVAAICECLAFPATLAALWDQAHAVVRVRIIGHDPSSSETTYRAALLRVWKASPRITEADTLTFRRYTEPNEVEPYAVGQDFVVFLKWEAADRMFVRMSGGEGTVAAFAIEDGRIRSAPVAAYAGLEIDQLMNQLDALSGR